jgi:hypothetical protein
MGPHPSRPSLAASLDSSLLCMVSVNFKQIGEKVPGHLNRMHAHPLIDRERRKLRVPTAMTKMPSVAPAQRHLSVAFPHHERRRALLGTIVSPGPYHPDFASLAGWGDSQSHRQSGYRIKIALANRSRCSIRLCQYALILAVSVAYKLRTGIESYGSIVYACLGLIGYCGGIDPVRPQEWPRVVRRFS